VELGFLSPREEEEREFDSEGEEEDFEMTAKKMIVTKIWATKVLEMRMTAPARKE